MNNKEIKNTLKTMFGIVTCLLFFILWTRNVYAADDYPSDWKNAPMDSINDQWGYPNRECTSFVCWCLNTRNGIAFNPYYGFPQVSVMWGDARVWGSNARTLGLTVDNNPAVGSVAWSTNEEFGHVAWVSAVNGDLITVEEYNWNGDGAYHTQTKTKAQFNCSGYIHFKDINPSPDNSPLVTLDEASCPSEGKVTVRGWAFDKDDTSKALEIHVYALIDGKQNLIGYTIANQYRPDVNDVYGCGKYHGFQVTVPSPVNGNLNINVAAINIGSSGSNTWSGGKTVYIKADKTNPVISNVKITDVSSAGYTVTCNVSDNVGVKRVRFPSWTEQNGQDDLIWHEGTIKDGKASFTVLKKDHKNETNCKYITHIYAYDYVGNEAAYACEVVMQDSIREPVLPDGDYLIASAGSTDKTRFLYLDIVGTALPAATSTNVSVCYSDPSQTDLPQCEIWTIKYANGFYTIKQKGSNVSLDVQGASTDSGANVMVSTSHSGSNQKWAISENGRNGYRIQSQCNGLSLDVTGAVFSTGTNVQVSTNNNTDAQSWFFVPYKPSQPVVAGKYMFVSTLNSNYIVDVVGDTGNVSNNTNVRLWQDSAKNQFNSFNVVKLSNGYYKVLHAASGKAVEVTNGLSTVRSNVALCDDNGSIAQQWAIISNGSGYMLVSRCSGMAFNLENAVASNSVNISLGYRNNSPSQTWKFVQAEYSISYNMNGGNGTIPTQTKYYKNDIALSTTVPVKVGAEFLGWSTSKTATTAEYYPGSTYKADKNVILYAVWRTIEPKEIKFDCDSLTLQKGATKKITATVLPENAYDKTITWASNNPSVVSVDNMGNVIAIAPGNAVITAKTVNDISKECSVKVIVNPSGISLSSTAATIYYGESLSLSATLSPIDVTEKTIIWTSSNPTIATVNNGTVKPTSKGAGVVTITAKTVNGLTATCEVKVFADNNPENIFADIKMDTWQYKAAKPVYDKGYMTGKGELEGRVLFSPDTNIDRSQFVVALYSMDGKPETEYEQKFSDVKSSAWYAKQVTWASNNGIVAGNPDGTFGVYGKATREQLALMFYKYAMYKNYDVSVSEETNLDRFTDAGKVSSWAVTAIKWAVERGIISGKGSETAGYRIDPTSGATRAECAAMMNKFDKIYSDGLRMAVEDIEEPLALPAEEIEDISLPEEEFVIPEEEMEDILDDEEEEIVNTETGGIAQ